MLCVQRQNAGAGLMSGASSSSSELAKHRSGHASRSRSKSQEMGSNSDEAPGDVSGPTEPGLSPVSEQTAEYSVPTYYIILTHYCL